MLDSVMVLALSGCATIPDNLEGDYAQEPLPNAVGEDGSERPVRWGGVLLETRQEEDGTCMLLLARPLDRWYRPQIGAELGGEFIACQDGTLDPDVYVPGREVTVVGLLDGFAEGYVGEDLHLFPLVRTRSAHAWRPPTQFNQGPRIQQEGQSQPGSADRQVDRVERVRAVNAINRSDR